MKTVTKKEFIELHKNNQLLLRTVLSNWTIEELCKMWNSWTNSQFVAEHRESKPTTNFEVTSYLALGIKRTIYTVELHDVKYYVVETKIDSSKNPQTSSNYQQTNLVVYIAKKGDK